MPDLASTLAPFKIPSPEERAEMDRAKRESDERERNRQYLSRIQNCDMPVIFRDADISKCDGAIRRWLNKTMNENMRRDLLILGEPGRGKSYAACACLNTLVRKYRCLYTDEKDMLDNIQATFGSYESEQAVLSRYKIPDFLVIDDFGESGSTDWIVTHLFQIIKRRHAMRRPTIFTSMYEPSELFSRLTSPSDKKKAAAVFSRLSDGVTVVLQGEDRRGKWTV